MEIGHGRHKFQDQAQLLVNKYEHGWLQKTDETKAQGPRR